MPRQLPTDHQKTLPPLRLLTVVRHPIRWKLLELMIDGTELSATQVAPMLNQDVDVMIRQLGILRRAKIVEARYHDKDRRFLMYSIRKDLSPQPGVLDFGFCVFYLSGSRPS